MGTSEEDFEDFLGERLRAAGQRGPSGPSPHQVLRRIRVRTWRRRALGGSCCALLVAGWLSWPSAFFESQTKPTPFLAPVRETFPAAGPERPRTDLPTMHQNSPDIYTISEHQQEWLPDANVPASTGKTGSGIKVLPGRMQGYHGQLDRLIGELAGNVERNQKSP